MRKCWYQPDSSVTGVNPNPSMLAVARRMALVFDWQEGSAEELSFYKGSFDAVVDFTDTIPAYEQMADLSD